MSDIYTTKFRPFVQLETQAEEVSIGAYKSQLNAYATLLQTELENKYGSLISSVSALTPEIIEFSGGDSVTLSLQANKVYVQTDNAIKTLIIDSSYPKNSPYETLIFFSTIETGEPSIVFPNDFVSLNADSDWVLAENSKYVISLLYGVFAIKQLIDNAVTTTE